MLDLQEVTNRLNSGSQQEVLKEAHVDVTFPCCLYDVVHRDLIQQIRKETITQKKPRALN